MSCRDFPFIKDISGGSLKICLRDDWFCIKSQFFIKACLRLRTDDWYNVTKGKTCFGLISFYLL